MDLPEAYMGDDEDEWADIALGLFCGNQGLKHSELESMVCDLLLVGWVFRKSKLWRNLHRDCRHLICMQMVLVKGPFTKSSAVQLVPKEVVAVGWRPKLNYKRRAPRGLRTIFEHPFLPTDAGRFAFSSTWEAFFGPPAPPPGSRDWPPPVRERGYGENTATRRDKSNRDASGRIKAQPRHRPRTPRPKNVVWKKGTQTGRRWKGK